MTYVIPLPHVTCSFPSPHVNNTFISPLVTCVLPLPRVTCAFLSPTVTCVIPLPRVTCAFLSPIVTCIIPLPRVTCAILSRIVTFVIFLPLVTCTILSPHVVSCFPPFSYALYKRYIPKDSNIKNILFLLANTRIKGDLCFRCDFRCQQERKWLEISCREDDLDYLVFKRCMQSKAVSVFMSRRQLLSLIHTNI